MADTIQILLELDASKAGESFNKIGDQAKVVGGSIEKSIGKSASLSFSQLAAGAAIAGAAVLAVKGAVDSIVSALKNVDQINQINAQFEVLAKNAGQSASTLQSAFESASGGLLDTEEVLGSANKALIELSGFATQLPKLFELATAQTKIFGGEATSNFEAITRAVASGNAARLKGIGIFIDSTKAIEDFAKANGVSVAALSENGRQQAVLNAVLQKGSAIVETAAVSTASTTVAITKIGVAIQEFGDAGSIAIEKVFGSVFRGAISYATTAINFYSDVLKNTFGDTSKLDQTNAKLAEQAQILKDQSAALEKNRESYDRAGLTAGIEASIAATQSKITGLITEINKLKSETSKPSGSDASPIKLFDDKILAEQSAKFKLELSGLTAARISAQTDALDSEFNTSIKQQELVRLTSEALYQIQNEYDLKERDLRARASLDRLASEGTLTESLAQLNETRAARLQSTLAGFNQKIVNNITEIEKIVRSGIVNGIAASFTALGGALAKGQNGFAAFSDAVIKSIGAVAIQIGTLLVTMGLGFQSVGLVFPTWAAAGAGAVLQGIALITLGGALQASGGGAGGGGGDSSISPSAIAGPGAPTLEDDAVLNGGRSRVTVNIQGDVLDSRDTGLRIVELIQSAFDTDGAQAVMGRA